MAVLYDAYAGGSVLSAAGLESMASYERQLLDVEGRTEHCRRVYASAPDGSRDAGSHACASASSLLGILYLNQTSHQEGCMRGFCMAPPSALSLCTSGAQVWGVPPCVSTIFDWRDGTLADEALWPTLLMER